MSFPTATSNMVRACAAKSVFMMCDMQPVFAKTIQKMVGWL